MWQTDAGSASLEGSFWYSMQNGLVWLMIRARLAPVNCPELQIAADRYHHANRRIGDIIDQIIGDTHTVMVPLG